MESTSSIVCIAATAKALFPMRERLHPELSYIAVPSNMHRKFKRNQLAIMSSLNTEIQKNIMRKCPLIETSLEVKIDN
jgi:hypothetical protein